MFVLGEDTAVDGDGEGSETGREEQGREHSSRREETGRKEQGREQSSRRE